MDTRMREYDGVMSCIYLALNPNHHTRHSRNEGRIIWYPFQSNDSEHCSMDTRMREYDGVMSCIYLALNPNHYSPSYQKWGTNYLVSILK